MPAAVKVGSKRKYRGPALPECPTDDPIWPAKSLWFKTWNDEWVFDWVRKVLKERGWKSKGNLCNPENLDELEDIVHETNGFKLPSRCLWWIHEDDARRVKELPYGDTKFESRHCISTFLGTDAATTKVAVTRDNNCENYYPKAYILPVELDLIKKAIKSSKKNTYWIAKPRNDCAGRGMSVYEGKDEEFQKLLDPEDKSVKLSGGKEYVVQTYICNPLLLGGFKFHFRMYTVIAGVLDDFEAYLYRDGHVLFSTKPFTMSKNSLGANFDKFNHLTNWSINFTKGNKHLAEDKKVIGPGCEWALSSTLKLIKQHYPKFSVEKFWEEMTEVCAKTMYKIAQGKNVRRHKVINSKHLRFENFGLDLMMDSNFKIWLLEGNTEVGLNPCYAQFPDDNCPKGCTKKNGCFDCKGGRNVRDKENNKVVTDVINSSVALMQLDVPKKKRVSRCLIPLHPIANKETMECAGMAAKAAAV